MMMIKNMVQIHDEQRSIQMTILRRNTHKKHCSDKHCDYNKIMEARSSKCRPESDTQ